MSITLSKSALQLGVQCPRALWFKSKMSYSKDPIEDEADTAMFEIGNMVGDLARHYFDDCPGECVLISVDRGFEPSSYEIYANETINAMNDPNVHTIAEAAFFVDGLVVFVDLLHRRDDGGWDIYEVKSSHQAKPVHAQDAAWQTYVVRTLCGVDVRNTYLMIPNRGWRSVSGSPDDFLVVDDYSNWIYSQSFSNDIPETIGYFWNMLASDNPPFLPEDVFNVGSSERCISPYQCSYTNICRECAQNGV